MSWAGNSAPASGPNVDGHNAVGNPHGAAQPTGPARIRPLHVAMVVLLPLLGIALWQIAVWTFAPREWILPSPAAVSALCMRSRCSMPKQGPPWQIKLTKRLSLSSGCSLDLRTPF